MSGGPLIGGKMGNVMIGKHHSQSKSSLFLFVFLNKGTAIPFLVPTYPERKAILVM